MGTLEEQSRAYAAALVYIEVLKAVAEDYPYKLSQSDRRQVDALINQSSYGAFRLAPAESKGSMGTREKQAWEGLGNIPKTESMRRLVDKCEKLKMEEDLAVNAAKHK